MFRKFIRTVFALAALIPLSWGIREITKSAIFDWIVQRLEGSLGLEEAEVIAFISTYAIPLAMSAITITFVLWLGVRWGRQATTTVGVPLAPNGNMPSEATKNVEPQIQIESQPTLRRHYEGEDRRRLGNIMYSLHELLNKGIFPAQLEVHEITSGFLYRVRNEGSQFIVDKLLELRGAFSAVRDELIRFIPGNGYYADEIHDILSNRDYLNAELVAIDDYLVALKAISKEPQDQFMKMMNPYQAALGEANFNLGTWVGECNKRINAKRDALNRH